MRGLLPVGTVAGFVATAGAAGAQEVAPAVDAISIGRAVGMAILVIFALLIALSVVAKLLIVSGLVPKTPAKPVDFAAHALANFVGGLRRSRPRSDAGGSRRLSSGGPSRKS